MGVPGAPGEYRGVPGHSGSLQGGSIGAPGGSREVLGGGSRGSRGSMLALVFRGMGVDGPGFKREASRLNPGPGARAQMGGLPFEPRPGEVEGQDVLGRLLWGDGPGEEPCGGDPKSKENAWPSKRHKHTLETIALLSLMPPTGGRISLTIFIRPDMAASLLAAQPPFLIL